MCLICVFFRKYWTTPVTVFLRSPTTDTQLQLHLDGSSLAQTGTETVSAAARSSLNISQKPAPRRAGSLALEPLSFLPSEEDKMSQGQLLFFRVNMQTWVQTPLSSNQSLDGGTVIIRILERMSTN